MSSPTLDPALILSENAPHSALVLVNRVPESFEQMLSLAKATTKRVLLDGAANRFAKTLAQEKLPIDCVIGDGDSIEPSTLEFLNSEGIPFHFNGDQYSTDLMKALHYIKEQWPEIVSVYAYSAPGGRADHAWSTYLCTHIAHGLGLQLNLVNADSIVCYVPEGTTTIKTPLNLVGDTAGFMPLMGSTRISIEGFKWDVENWETSFETVLSTSNVLVRDYIVVSTDKSLLFSVEIRSK